MPYDRSEGKIKKVIEETLSLEEQVGKMLLQVDENKKKIQSYFDENGLKVLEVHTTNKKLIAKKHERATIKYDVEKLRGRLDKDVFNEVTKRTYTISDIDGLIKLIRSAGISASEFKSYINVDVKADTQRLKELYEVKEVTLKDLKGCYTATISKNIKISEEIGD